MTLFGNKKKKLEEKFAKLNQTTNGKEALEYVVYKKQGTLEELKKRVHLELIRQFEGIGYITIQGDSYKFSQ